MNNSIKFQVSFRILGDKLEPLEVTELLGITPVKSHRKGETNKAVSKKGKIIEYTPFSIGTWVINSKEDSYADLNHHIKSLLNLLYPLKGELAKLSNKGYKLDMFCGAFLDECYQPGFEINPDILLQLGELNISFGVCIYH